VKTATIELPKDDYKEAPKEAPRDVFRRAVNSIDKDTLKSDQIEKPPAHPNNGSIQSDKKKESLLSKQKKTL
jgi:hypothetical protein